MSLNDWWSDKGESVIELVLIFVGIVLMLAGIILGFTVSWYFLILTAATWLGMVLSGNCPLLCMLRARLLRPTAGNCAGCCSTK
jgi:hypothetical protein